MRQQLLAATQMKRIPRHDLFVSQDEIDRCTKNIFGLVAQRAYELFENRGHEHGHDYEDWFQAELEVLTPVTMELSDPGDAYVAVVSVSGYRPEDLKISVEPRSLTICAMCGAESADSNGSREGSEQSGKLFLSFSLATQIDTSAVSANIKHEVLEVRLPKACPQTQSAGS